MLQSFSILFLISALSSYINYKFIKLPSTIALLLLGALFTIVISISRNIIPSFYIYFCHIVINADFKTLLFDGILSFLLFAGAIHVNISDLAKEKWAVLLFASLGVLISTIIVGVLVYWVSQLMRLNLPIIYALVFGALISPTDPIAVIAILKKAGIEKSLETKIKGESLFNDGIGVVVFSGVLLLVETDQYSLEERPIAYQVGMFFLEQALGGVAFGVVLGLLAYYLISSVKENSQLVTILSLAVAMGGYSIASQMDVSGPLAMVVSGLILGSKFHLNTRIDKTHKVINETWEILDEVLNGVLFLLIGISAHLLHFEIKYIMLAAITFFVVLVARFVSVIIPFSLLKHESKNKLRAVVVLTWGGLRGGISLALALTLPNSGVGNPNEIIFFITYVVVFCSILFQGLSISSVVKKVLKK